MKEAAVAKIPSAYSPAPTLTPIAATTQSDAAVVSPRMLPPFFRIAPAPRKPTPVTTYATTRDGSRTTPGSPPKARSPQA